MDKPKILLIAHSTPTLPSQKEGREYYPRLNQQSGNLRRKTKKFPLLPSGENGEGGNILGELSIWLACSKTTLTLRAWKNKSQQYF